MYKTLQRKYKDDVNYAKINKKKTDIKFLDEKFKKNKNELFLRYAHVLFLCGKNSVGEKSLESFKNACKYFEKADKFYDLECIQSYVNMGLYYISKNNYDEGIKNYYIALYSYYEIVKSCEYIWDELDISRLLGRIQFLLTNKDQYVAKLEFARFGLRLKESRFGFVHDELSVTSYNVAISYINLLDYERGIEYLKRSLELKCRYNDNLSETVLITMEKLIEIYINIKRYEDAMILAKKIYDSKKKLSSSLTLIMIQLFSIYFETKSQIPENENPVSNFCLIKDVDVNIVEKKPKINVFDEDKIIFRERKEKKVTPKNLYDKNKRLTFSPGDKMRFFY